MRRQFLISTILFLTATLSMAQDELPANPITPGIDVDSPVIICGDVTGDGVVDTNDVIAISRHITGTADTTFNKDAADTNDDGKINIVDVAAIISYCIADAAANNP